MTAIHSLEILDPATDRCVSMNALALPEQLYGSCVLPEHHTHVNHRTIRLTPAEIPKRTGDFTLLLPVRSVTPQGRMPPTQPMRVPDRYARQS